MLGEDNIKAVLRRLDRLTQEEAQVTVAQTLEVVGGLVSNMRVVMDGASKFNRPVAFLIFLRTDGKVSTEGIRQALSKFGFWLSDAVQRLTVSVMIVAMQEATENIHKMRRLFFPLKCPLIDSKLIRKLSNRGPVATERSNLALSSRCLKKPQ